MFVVQHQQVDVGVRQQLAAAVAADRDQAQAGGLLGQELQPGLVQYLVHQVGAGVDQGVGGGAFLEQAAKALATPLEGVAESGDRLLALARQAGAHFARRKHRRGGVFGQIEFGAHQCGTFSSLRSVRMS